MVKIVAVIMALLALAADMAFRKERNRERRRVSRNLRAVVEREDRKAMFYRHGPPANTVGFGNDETARP